MKKSSQFMFKLISSIPSFWFNAVSQSSVRYIIKNGSYLIEAPPKRPASSYALYIKEELSGNKKIHISAAAAAMSKKWKTYPELHVKYNQKAQKQNAGYDKLKENYENKYVKPFKRISAQNLRLKKLFDDKKIDIKKGQGIKHISEQVTEALKVRSIAQDQQLIQAAKKIKIERQELKKQFKFPQILYPTQKSYEMKNNTQNKSKEDKDVAYKAYVDSWKLQVKKWLEENKYQLTIDEFMNIYHTEQIDKKKSRKKQSEKAQHDEIDDNIDDLFK